MLSRGREELRDDPLRLVPRTHRDAEAALERLAAEAARLRLFPAERVYLEKLADREPAVGTYELRRRLLREAIRDVAYGLEVTAHDIGPGASADAWADRVLRRAVDRVRARAERQRQRGARIPRPTAPEELTALLDSSAPAAADTVTPDDALLLEELQARALEGRRADVVALMLAGYRLTEVAQLLRISSSSARTYYRRALVDLQKAASDV